MIQERLKHMLLILAKDINSLKVSITEKILRGDHFIWGRIHVFCASHDLFVHLKKKKKNT